MSGKRASLVIAGMVMGAGTIFAPSAAANEVGIQSADCNTWHRGNTGYAYCSDLGTVGAHRVKVVCTDSRGVESTAYGRWVANAKTSKRNCPGSSYLVRVGSVLRD